jgi:exodeoxyribonuclease VII small subunit
MSSKKSVDLEKSLSELEAIVEELESGDLSLEKAMQKFEQGIKLTRGCQTALKDAEQKVEILLGVPSVPASDWRRVLVVPLHG